MEDLTSWVSRQAQNMGIDFSCLSSHTRDQIISTLMSGLENGFRSRMDSPDLRFAKRRGIGAKNQTQSAQLSTNNQETKANTASDELPKSLSIDADLNCVDSDLNCPSGDTNCGNTSCQIDSQCSNTLSCTYQTSGGCTDANNSCTNAPGETCINEGSACHNSACTNQTGTTCTDSLGCTNSNGCVDKTGCVDNTCVNSMISGCSDRGAGENACKDDACSNQNNCADGIEGQAGNCTDVNRCSNTSPATCSDSDKCIDDKCLNNADCGDKMPLVGACKDDFCMNKFCDDGGENSLVCLDSGCINSSTSATGGNSCKDEFCTDNHCMNFFPEKNHCQDTSCGDTGCWNQVPDKCLDSSNCTNKACLNMPISSSCDNVMDTPADYGCVDSGDDCHNNGTTTGCVDNQTNCIDRPSGPTVCTDGGCENDTICIDEDGCIDEGCKNSGDKNICHDGSSNSCVDNQCENNGLCVNVEGQCSDNECINENCINIGQTCGNSPTTCTDGNCDRITPP